MVAGKYRRESDVFLDDECEAEVEEEREHAEKGGNNGFRLTLKHGWRLPSKSRECY